MNTYTQHLDRIEISITMACTGLCKHCQNGDQSGAKDHLDPEVVITALKEVKAHYPIDTLMIFGGEPLLYPEDTCAIQKVAAELNIAKRQIITNGFFSRNEDRIRKVASMIADAGVNELLLSVDAFHQETIPLGPVRLFAQYLCEFGVPFKLQPAWLVSKEDNNPYNIKTREILHSFDALDIPWGDGNVIFPAGNALVYLKDYFDTNIDESSPYEEDPYDVTSLSFEANGDVLQGNIYQSDIMDIISSYNPDADA